VVAKAKLFVSNRNLFVVTFTYIMVSVCSKGINILKVKSFGYYYYSNFCNMYVFRQT